MIRSGFLMKPLFERAVSEPQRLVYTDGEEEPVLRAVQVVVDEGVARPILIGRPEVIEMRIERLGLRLAAGTDFELSNPDNDPRYNDYVEFYRERMGRNGVSPQAASDIVRTRRTVIGAIMLAKGEADALLAGPVGSFSGHLRHIIDVIGLNDRMRRRRPCTRWCWTRDRCSWPTPMSATSPTRRRSPRPRWRPPRSCAASASSPRWRCCRRAISAAATRRRRKRMRDALDLITKAEPGLEVDGEMHADCALVTRSFAIACCPSRG